MPRLSFPAAIISLCALAAAPLLPAMQHGRPFDPLSFSTTVSATGLTTGDRVPNFRLTDHLGNSHELYHESAAKAVILVFTATGSPRVLQNAASLRALRARFPAADLTLWQIDSGQRTDRAAVAAEQSLYNLATQPVLLDDASLVATELGAARQLDTFLIDPRTWTILYRGPLDNADPAATAPATQIFAGDLAASLITGGTGTSLSIPSPATAPTLDLPAPPSINYTADIAPLVLNRCVTCHSPGNIAPHVYARHADLASRASSIRADLLEKRMVPWHADSFYGAFANNPALTTAEAAQLFAWCRAGAPRGTGADPLATTPPPAASDWPLGPPDRIISIPTQSLPATGVLAYRYLPVAVPATKWLRAAVVKPGNRKVLHHAIVFEGTLLDVITAGVGQAGYFADYVPGLEAIAFPAGTGKKVTAGNFFIFQLHYITTGRAETDTTELGLYYTDTAPALELQTKSAYNSTFTIPPGAKAFPVEATFMPSASKDTLLYELTPHAHYRGHDFRFEALYPDGTSEILLNVPKFDFDWQRLYRLAQPKRLPAGTTIRVRGTFDNSAQNPANPDPTATVKFGEQTFEEMFIGYLNYAELPAKAAAPAPIFARAHSATGTVGVPFATQVAARHTVTAYSASGLPAGLAIDPATGAITGTPAAPGRSAITVTATNAAGSAATPLALTVMAPASAPAFVTQPQSVRSTLGATVTLTAAATGSPAPTYEWRFKGGEFCNTVTPTLTLTNLTAAYAGEFTCVATNATGSVASAPATLSLDFSGLVNLSARARVGSGADLVIPGISVRGTKPKTLLIRAIGPTLATFGVTGTLANPTVAVFDAAGQKILVNDNWAELPDATALKLAADAQGAFAIPASSSDAALLVTLPPGSYTVQVSGLGDTAAARQGVALVEVYEADATSSTLVNLSCRARVGTGADVLIAGFVIRGASPRRVLIRGIGPSLAAFGVAGALADPKLELFAGGASAAFAANDNWTAPGTGAATPARAEDFAAVGAFALPPDSKDAALILTLPPGSYTAQVSGVANTTGVAIVEVYEIP